MSKFRNAKGRLTRYALGCGYVERKDIGSQSVTMWHEGGPAIHVRQHDGNHGRVFWDTFTTLAAARKRYDQACRVLRIET